MRRQLAVLVLALEAGACNSAVCAPELFEVDGACLTVPVCDEPCGAHEICDGSTRPYSCKCAPGYEGVPCAWVGVVRDPEFEGLQNADGESYWVDEGDKGATIVPSVGGGGEGSLFASVVCNAGGLSQVLEMPSYRAAGAPLMAEVTYQADDVEGAAIGFDRAWRYLPATLGHWETARFCLGEAAFGQEPNGGPVKLQVSASERAPGCFEDEPVGKVRVDELFITPADPGSCPPPGDVLNGAANVEDGGWKFAQEGVAEAALVEGVGQGGSDGARLLRESGSTDLAAMSTQVSVPTPGTLPFPAIRFWWRGSSTQAFQVELGTFVGLGEPRRSLDRLIGNNAERNNIYCLPPWTHGNVVDITFSLVDEGAVDETELLVDEVEVVSDPDCGESTDLLDPGFESAPNRWPGVYLGASPNQAAIMQDDGALARNGDGVFELTYWTSEAEMRFESFVLVPPSDEAGGPQLVFHSDVVAVPETTVEWVLGRADEKRGDLTPGGDWQRNEVCLPPEWAGRWFRFQVRVGPPNEAGIAISTKRVFLDDFELTTSADCPAVRE